MNKYKNPPNCKFINDAVWIKILLKVSAFYFWDNKRADVTRWLKMLSLILIIAIVQEPCFFVTQSLYTVSIMKGL